MGGAGALVSVVGVNVIWEEGWWNVLECNLAIREGQEGHELMGIVCSVKMAPLLCIMYISKALQSLRGLTLAIMCDVFFRSIRVHAAYYSLACIYVYVYVRVSILFLLTQVLLLPLHSVHWNQKKKLLINPKDLLSVT